MSTVQIYFNSLFDTNHYNMDNVKLVILIIYSFILLRMLCKHLFYKLKTKVFVHYR